jgi:hypothetical protein
MQKIPYKTDQNNPAIRAYKEAVEKGKKNQHVLPYGEKWAVTNLASGIANYVFNNPQEAMKHAEANATQGTAVFIHGSDGRIKERKDY